MMLSLMQSCGEFCLIKNRMKIRLKKEQTETQVICQKLNLLPFLLFSPFSNLELEP